MLTMLIPLLLVFSFSYSAFPFVLSLFFFLLCMLFNIFELLGILLNILNKLLTLGTKIPAVILTSMFTLLHKVIWKECDHDKYVEFSCYPLPSSCFIIRSVAQSCPTLCDSMSCRTPGLPVHHQLPDITQTHIHRVGDAIQPSHPLLSPSPPAFNLTQYQSLFQ